MLLAITELVLMYLPLACGAYLIFSLLRVPDFSIEGAFVMGALAGYGALQMVPSLPLVVLAGALGGMVVGTMQSVLMLVLRVPCLLASIVNLGLCSSMALALLGGSYVSLTHLPRLLPNASLMVTALAVLGSVLVLYVFLRSSLGTCLRVYGMNPNFFGHYGISTNYIVAVGLLLASACAGIAGCLVAQTNLFVDVHMGHGIGLFALSALMLGKRLAGAHSSLLPLLGILAYAFLQQLLLKLGLGTQYFAAVQALTIVGLLVLTRKNSSLLHNDHLGV